MKLKTTLILVGCSILGVAAFSYMRVKTEPTSREGVVMRESPRDKSFKRDSKKTALAALADRNVRWEVKRDMLTRISAKTLTSAEEEYLYSLLYIVPEPQDEKYWWVVVNEVMEQLRIHGIGAERYTRTMLDIINDSQRHDVIRDYAVQHVSMWVTPRGIDIGEPYETDSALVQETVETMTSLVTDPSLSSSTIVGTTLRMLASMQNGGADEQLVDSAIAKISPWIEAAAKGEKKLHLNNRISAITAIGLFSMKEHLGMVRSIATSESVAPTLRLHCISTIALIGENSDLETLDNIASSDKRLRYAVNSAKKKLLSTSL